MNNKPELGKVIAFYSYKGGTGRTMALANVGCALARDAKLPRPVLLVDWDLEAPGLHRYLRKQVVTAFGGDEDLFDNAPGLIDLFIELQNRISVQSDLPKPEQDFDAVTALLNEFQIQSYIIKTDVPRLHLLKAGRFDSNYAANIAQFRWPELYHRSPLLLRAFADRLANDYSFVAIDSRTGLTDTSGICAMLMPEILVSVFTPNRQSLYGVIDLVHEAARYRARSDDLRPLIIYPLPSRIEPSEPALRQSWRFGDSSAGVPGFQGMFEQAFKEIYELSACDLGPYFDDVQIQHLPSYAYGEEIALLVEETGDRFSLTQSYLRFSARVAKGDLPWASSSSGKEAIDDQILIERRLPLEPGWHWFLSHNTRDQALAERVKAEIERKDATSRVFSPINLQPGDFWSVRLFDEIAKANAFILLVGEHGISAWQRLEYYEALDKRAKYPGFPILVILLEGQTAPGLPFLRQLHWIITNDAALEKAVAQLIDVAAGGGARRRDLWQLSAPYRGLAAMTEGDAEFFFGRERETVEVIEALAATPNRLPILLGNSGVGKSSVAQAGVLAALMRQSWPETATTVRPWPEALSESRRWCFLKLRPGTDPLRALVESFLSVWQFDVVDPGRVSRLPEWTDVLLQGRATLRDLIDATERRLREVDATKPPVFLIYIDQGEELYVRAEVHQRRRFSAILADGLGDHRLRAMMSMRADFFGELQSDEPFYSVHRLINIPPMREAQLRDVVSRPAELLSARFETPKLVDIITRRAAEDSDALPLLSYILDNMWTQMVQRGDGVLRLAAQSLELGSMLAQRADAFLAHNPEYAQALRSMFLRLVTVGEDREPTRRRASRSEFSDEEWRLVSELTDYPNRLLVTATSGAGDTYAEVASEAVFRRWDRLREWIAAEREFLAWRGGLEAARRAWQETADASKNDALLMGAALTQAHAWLERRTEDLPDADREFIVLSVKRERQAQARSYSIHALLYVLLVGVISGLIGWINQSYIAGQIRWWTVTRPFMVSQVRPYVLPAAAEQGLKPGSSFRECAAGCPEMIVIPAGSFLMGSPHTEERRFSNEDPQHQVTIAQQFAVSKFELTFDEWDTCVTYGDCETRTDAGWGRGKRPMIFVSWNDAQQYVAWLSKMTGKLYRLLSEAEYEYATRGGRTTAFPWGNDIGQNNANCDGCGSQWDNKQTAPVGSFAPNGFGLYDMVGNVFEWTEDCYHDSYNGAPIDGSAWTAGGDCSRRVVRGGSWSSNPTAVRSAGRSWSTAENRNSNLGFRIGRILAR